jgi:glycosyltransferase involved in cell wall biosynthesis
MDKGVVRAAFVIEQTLGHITHTRNLHAAAEAQHAVAPTWLPIPFEVGRAQRFIPLMRNNWSVRASWRARRALNTALKQRPHDVLFFHTQVTSLFSTSLIERYPSVVSLDATPIGYDQMGVSYGHRPAGDGLVDRRKFEMNRRVFNAADRLVAWSDWARRSLIEDYAADPDKIVVVAPGASAGFFDIGRRRRELLAARSSQTPARILFVGGDFQRKGGQLLLEIMRTELGHHCELHIVTTQNIHGTHNVFVHRAGPNSPELMQLFETADLFVLPSFGDCLALVLMEAAAAGLPIITTDVGALSEAVRDGDSGLVVPPGDTGALKAALSAIVDHPARRLRMGVASAEIGHQKFDAARNNAQLLSLLAELAQPSSMMRRAA